MKNIFYSTLLVFCLFLSGKSQNDTWKTFPLASLGDRPDTSVYSIASIAFDNSNNIWVLTNFGVAKINGNIITPLNTSNSGLISNYTYTITKDTYGHLWFSSSSGLTMFDGINWTSYTTSNSNIPSNQINTITPDTKGNIWCSFPNLGVSKFDGNTWTTYTTNNTPNLASNSVDQIEKDNEGNLWFRTINGVSKFDGISWTKYTSSNSGLIHNSITEIYKGKNGFVWFKSNNGISKFDGTTWTTLTTANSGLPDNTIYQIAEDTQNNMWFLTSYGVSRFDGTTWRKYNNSDFANTNIGICKLIADISGKVWIGSYNYGLWELSDSTWGKYNTSDFDSKYACAIKTDEKGHLWFGSAKGISVLLSEKKEIKGQVYLDKNQNQQKETTEPYITNQRVKIEPGNRVAFTDANGRYAFYADSGVSYTVNYVPLNSFSLTKDTSYTIIATNDATLPDFAVYRQTITKINSNISVDRSRCNTNSFIWYTYTNTGTTSADAKAILELDTNITIVNSFPAYDSIINNKVYISLLNFTEGSQRQIRLEVQNPDFTRTRDTLIYTSTLDFMGMTFTQTSKSVVFCSYDPNDKAVEPLPIGEENYTPKNSLLTYTIRFQNTGNDTAYKVMLRDTLDNWLNIETLEIVGNSHPVKTELDNNQLIFTFNNIYLPDSTTNEKESHGFVSYTIRTKAGIPDETIVKNTAHIYFDFNPAIVTNTVESNMVTVIPTPLGLNETHNNVSLAPNPISKQSTLHFNNKGGEATVHVLDVSGKTLLQQTTTGNSFEFNTQDFPKAGLYFYQLHTTEGTSAGKLMVE